MIFEHVSTGYSSTDSDQESLFLQKKSIPAHEAPNQEYSIVIAIQKSPVTIVLVIYE